MSNPAAHSRLLHRFYSDIPRHYDLINTIMTWGLDRRWRKLAARECLSSGSGRLLDIGCGTGEMTIELARQAGKNSEIIGLDFNRSMLKVAQQKVEREGIGNKLSFISGDVAGLPFPDGYFDGAVSSFSFRNLSYDNPIMEQYISQVLRVLNDSGRFVILETSQPGWFLKKLYNIYMRYFIYWLGWLISGSREAYRYLAESVVNYYTADELRQILLKAGFRRVYFRRLFLGVVSIHTAIK